MFCIILHLTPTEQNKRRSEGLLQSFSSSLPFVARTWRCPSGIKSPSFCLHSLFPPLWFQNSDSQAQNTSQCGAEIQCVRVSLLHLPRWVKTSPLREEELWRKNRTVIGRCVYVGCPRSVCVATASPVSHRGGLSQISGYIRGYMCKCGNSNTQHFINSVATVAVVSTWIIWSWYQL